MTDKPENDPVSLRDYFAGKAMQGMLASQEYADIRDKNWLTEISHADKIAKQAYFMAAAMLKARQNEN